MKSTLTKLLIVPFLTIAISACSMGKTAKNSGSSEASSTGVGAGGGASVPGHGALSVPTADALVIRITNGLQGNVSPTAGNFKSSLAQVKNNLPKVTDPTKATGFDQAQLLVYAACSDLTTGNPGLMASKYNVTKNATIANNKAALIQAGVTMLDQYTAGLASQGPTAANVVSAYDALIQKIAADAGNNSTIAFMSVCIAANTAGSTLMSF